MEMDRPRRRVRAVLVFVFGALALGAGSAPAADIGVRGRKLRLMDEGSGAARSRVKYRASDPAIAKGAGTDVDRIQARFDVRWGRARGTVLVPRNVVPGAASGWIDVDEGSARFRVRSDAPLATAARKAEVRVANLLRLVARSSDPLAVPIAAGAQVGESVFTAFTITNDGETVRHCSEFLPGSCSYRGSVAGRTTLTCSDGLPDPACQAAPLTPRVLVVGLDGGDWRYLQPLIDGGFVPAIADFQSAAAWGGLDCVPANPAFPCFCPIVWTSIATGWSSADHRIFGVAQPPSARNVPAIWNVLRRFDPTVSDVALASYRNTWPPEADTTWNVTEPGAFIIGEEHFFQMCPGGDAVAEGSWPGSTSQPDTWTQPADLFESLGLIPSTDPQRGAWVPKGADRTSQRALVALLTQLPEAPRLTMFILHHIDKTEHLVCQAVTLAPFGDVDAAALVAEAEAYTGPPNGGCFAWSTVAGSYREADEQVAAVLATQAWDYVVFASDHGMTYYSPTNQPPCHHTLPPALDSGTFGVRGPGVQPGPIDPQSVLCVTPLLAYLLDLPVSTALPCVASGAFATMLETLFTPAHLQTNPPAYTNVW